MRWHIIIIMFVIISIFLFPKADAARINCILGNEEDFNACKIEHGTCYKDVSDDGKTLICWIEDDAPEEPPEEVPAEEIPEENQLPPEKNKQNLPEGSIVNAEKINNREIVINFKTKEEENAEFILRLIEDKIPGSDDLIYKPKLDINFDIKKVIKIPPFIDVKLIPYILYILLGLSSLALILILLIIKDIIEPKMRL